MNKIQKIVAKQLKPHLSNLIGLSINVRKNGVIEVTHSTTITYTNFDDAWCNSLKYSNYPEDTYPDLKNAKRVKVTYE